MFPVREHVLHGAEKRLFSCGPPGRYGSSKLFVRKTPMSTGTNGQLVQYKNSAVEGLYLLEDDHAQAPPQLTAIRIEKLVESCPSPYQHIAIYESTYHGNV